jgi:glycosyltransferase involved in cell wall biosynthesis
VSAPIRVLELRSVRGTGGGPEKTILLGSAATDPGRARVTVCYVRHEQDRVFGVGDWAQRLDLDYVEIRERHAFDIAAWRRLLSIVRERQIDIVHAHEYKTNLMALLAARWTGVAPLSTAHGWTGHSFRERWIYYPGDRKILAKYPRLIAVSTQIKDELVAAGAVPGAVTVILNAIDSTAFVRDPDARDAVRSSCGFTSDDIVIGAVGRLEPQKRFDLLLDAIAALRPAHPRLRCAIVGDGTLRSSLEAHAARLGLADACRWLGHRQDVANLHNGFDVFVQSSDYEGTPNAVLEAMAMETPIVATDAGGTRELAQDGIHALIVPPGSAQPLAAALSEVLADPTTAKVRATAARQRVEIDLSFAARTRRLEEVYAAMMDDRQRPRATPVQAAGPHRA